MCPREIPEEVEPDPRQAIIYGNPFMYKGRVIMPVGCVACEQISSVPVTELGQPGMVDAMRHGGICERVARIALSQLS